jgi:hypothetical protein
MLMADKATGGTKVVMSEDEVQLKPQQMWAREIFPPTDNERTWWLGVALRWSDTPRWKAYPQLAAYMQDKLVIACIDQAARPMYVAKEFLDSRASAVKFAALAPTPESSYIVGWMADGGSWSLGKGITARVDALKDELKFRYDKDPACLSAAERAVHEMSHKERYERCVRLMNATLESGNALSLQSQRFSEALTATDQDKSHGRGGVGEMSQKGQASGGRATLTPGPTAGGSSSRESSASESVVEGYTESDASEGWKDVHLRGKGKGKSRVRGQQ